MKSNIFIFLYFVCNGCCLLRAYNETNNNTQIIISKTFKMISPSLTKTNELYSSWSNWSKCRNCRQIRKKYCLSSLCNNSIVYEKKLCQISRCKRRNTHKKRNITQRSQIRRFDVRKSKSRYTKWSSWSPCSEQCTTRRQRLCKRLGECEHNLDVEMAYCYLEGTVCHKWIQSMLKKKDSTNNKKNNYDKKVRKCGYPYRTKNKYNGMMKIMGGHITDKTKWPWHVALLNVHKEVFCGGTLISPNWVLTAAHCVRRVLYVKLNDYDIRYDDGSEIEYLIKEKYQHPTYNVTTIDNDIALLKLPKTVTLPYACLPQSTSVPVNKKCFIVGWGRRSPYDLFGSRYLREAQVPIISKDLCKKSYRRLTITDNMLCAGYKDGRIDSCTGDSGGGLICLPKRQKHGWSVDGITSFGDSCGKKGKFGVYTNVRKYLTWIKMKIKQ